MPSASDSLLFQILREPATEENFDEIAYLLANSDVVPALKAGHLKSGLEHFHLYGRHESRWLTHPIEKQRKASKLDRIRPLLRTDMQLCEMSDHFDFLTAELREQFSIIDPHVASSNNYDGDGLSLIEKHQEGLILDCGAGSRGVYYQNVVNFEIAAYPSTDVRGVGEVLPFKDNSFDAVISIAVLEHVKDPWQCAREIIRVLKPGGDLLCAVPFLQPMHGYPHHYYNMTELGLRNLFCSDIDIARHEVADSTLPIWSLSWILNSWANGLDEETRKQFMDLRVADLMGAPQSYLSQPFVRGLSKEKNMELASATIIHGKKR